MAWKLVYANATPNKKMIGSLESLFDAIDNGVSIRIGLDGWDGSNMVSLRWNIESVRYDRQRTMALAAFPVHASNLDYNPATGAVTMAQTDPTHRPPVCVVRSDGAEHMFMAGVEYFKSNPAKDDRQYQWFADL